MHKGILVASLSACLFVFAGCKTIQGWVAGDVIKQNESLTGQVSQLSAAREELESQLGKLGGVMAENEQLKAQLVDATSQSEEQKRIAETLKAAKAAQEKELQDLKRLFDTIKGIKIRPSPEGTYIVMDNAILFEWAKADLTDDARQTLDKTVAAFLKDHPDQQIRIDGHTDGSHGTGPKVWKDNYELAAMRAHAVMEYLVSKGVPSNRMYIAGFGPNKPAVEPPTLDARVPENRRVEILLIPKYKGAIDSILEEVR